MNASNNKNHPAENLNDGRESGSELPRFQQLQAAMTQAIRQPELGYQISNGLANSDVNEIESRRIKVYQSLFYNNVEQFFCQIFPVCRSMFDNNWEVLIRKYLKFHHANTPLFHQLGLEFLSFINKQLDEVWLRELLHPMTVDSFLQLAHYEWVELELSLVEKAHKVPVIHGLSENDDESTIPQYRLADAVWPLYYEYALQSFQPPLSKQIKQDTFLLAQRVDGTNSKKQTVEFHELTAPMYALLMSFQKSEWVVSSKADFSFENAVKPHYTNLQKVSQELSEDIINMPEPELRVWLMEILPTLLEKGWLMQRSFE